MQYLTHAPIPGYSDIVKAFRTNHHVKDTKIESAWANSEDLVYWFSRSAWSIFTLAKYRFKVSGKKKINVWFPDYFCNSSITPLRDLNLGLTFYPISEDGSPNIDLCNKILKHSPPPDLFIAAHYFGKTIRLNNVSDFVKSNGGWLIEDAAQLLIPQDKVGEFSHFLIFSPHKFFPIPNGALLIIKKENLIKDYGKNLISSFNYNDVYESLINTSSQKQLSSNFWFCKRSLQRIGLHLLIRKKTDFYKDDLIVHTKNFIHPKINLLSIKMLSIMVKKIQIESETRRKNYQLWLNGLRKKGIYGLELFSKNNLFCPYLFGLTYKDTETANRIFRLLSNNNIPATTWPDLPPEVLSNTNMYRKAIELRKKSVFLPVHRSVNIDNINSALKRL